MSFNLYTDNYFSNVIIINLWLLYILAHINANFISSCKKLEYQEYVEPYMSS